ncbi:MAG TPA: BrnT family toxin [Blastocatellia bacterium]|nr:BrnT family toxin [Blastocatellia bacterium]
MKFGWHPPKAKSNLEKYGVSFEEAATVFDDDKQLHRRDDLHSFTEQRYLCLGMSEQSRLLMIVYTEQQEGLIRIISAPPATASEEEEYEQENYFT